MKAIMIWLSCAVALVLSAWAQPATDRPKDEAAIRQLNQQVLKAYNTGDLTTVEGMERGFQSR